MKKERRNGLISQEKKREDVNAQTDDALEYLLYHFNNIGSTTGITDESGEIKYTYTYSIFGKLLSGNYGEVEFLYNGQYGVASDDNGLYYMRARYYNIDIMRFINQDVLTGSIDSSQSLNRYAYVEGNPVSFLDPFGLSPYVGMIINGISSVKHVLSGNTVAFGLSIGGSLGIAWTGFVQIVFDANGNVAIQMGLEVGTGFPGVSASTYNSYAYTDSYKNLEEWGGSMGASVSSYVGAGLDLNFGDGYVGYTKKTTYTPSLLSIDMHGESSYTWTVFDFNLKNKYRKNRCKKLE